MLTKYNKNLMQSDLSWIKYGENVIQFKIKLLSWKEKCNKKINKLIIFYKYLNNINYRNFNKK
jgi:hypothetical protein